ncbi:MAG TPA: lytic transglycosylase domain-containing protein [Pyrinomonadaceae bacterium]|nr:lytic transglycosylase domain-containing protein [Pyrinomonadaceae bacterium]
MKKFPLLCLLALFGAVPALAQNGYRYDNFDVRDGVRVENVTTTAELPASGTVRRTAKTGLVINNDVVRPEPLLYRPRTGMSMAAGNSLKGFTTGDANVDRYIVEAGVRNNVDPVLLYAQMHQESSFKRGAISPKGARGLMQLMPGTAARFGVKNIFDPQQNIEGGARYMRFLLDHFDGDVALALAGYNAGEGAVLKYGRRIPPYRETQEYVRRISQRYAQMRDGELARTARSATPAQVAALQSEQPEPAPTYERKVFAVKLPDGRLQLISQ